MHRSTRLLTTIAAILFTGNLLVACSVNAQGQMSAPPQTPAQTQVPQMEQQQMPRPAKSESEELLSAWNDIHRKLIAMAEDFPEVKYNFKVQQDQRTFAQDILHVAGVDLRFIDSMTGKKSGLEGGDNPPRSVYSTKADVVKWIKQDAADGAALIEKQGDKGIRKEVKSVYSNEMGHIDALWWEYIEHDGEHYGQLVVYYRANNMVPPESRPQPKK